MPNVSRFLEYQNNARLLAALDEMPVFSSFLFGDSLKPELIFCRNVDYEDGLRKLRTTKPYQHFFESRDTQTFDDFELVVHADVYRNTRELSETAPHTFELLCVQDPLLQEKLYCGAYLYALSKSELARIKDKDLDLYGPKIGMQVSEYFVHAFPFYRKLCDSFRISTRVPVYKASYLQRSLLLPKEMDSIVQQTFEISQNFDYAVDVFGFVAQGETVMGALFFNKEINLSLNSQADKRSCDILNQSGVRLFELRTIHTDILATDQHKVRQYFESLHGKKKVYVAKSLLPLCYLYHRFGITNGLAFDFETDLRSKIDCSDSSDDATDFFDNGSDWWKK
jgi:hypothetical protein